MNDSNDSGQPNNENVVGALLLVGILALLLAFSLYSRNTQQKAAAGTSYDLASEVCIAFGNTPNFDSGQRRAIMEDYGFDLSSIARVENCIGYLFNDLSTPSWCPLKIGDVMKGDSMGMVCEVFSK